MFQLKKRPPDYQARKGRKLDDKGIRAKDGSTLLPPEKLPYLVELSPGKTHTTHTMSGSLISHPQHPGVGVKLAFIAAAAAEEEESESVE